MDRATGALRDSSFPIFHRCCIPAICWCSTTAASFPPASTPAAPCVARISDSSPPGRIEVLLTEPAGENLGAPSSGPARKVAIGERLVFPAPDRRNRCSKPKSSNAANSASACCASTPVERLLRHPRPHRPHAPAALYPPRRCRPRSRALPDRLLARARFCGRAHRRAALHSADPCALAASGVEVARITLHVGLGTFAPLRVDRLDEVRLHRERYTLSAASRRRHQSRRARGPPHRRCRHHRRPHAGHPPRNAAAALPSSPTPAKPTSSSPPASSSAWSAPCSPTSTCRNRAC